jgi:hypothetical protein
VPNKLECCITLGWKSLPGTNTLAYWAHCFVTEKMKCCEYHSCSLRSIYTGDIHTIATSKKHSGSELANRIIALIGRWSCSIQQDPYGDFLSVNNSFCACLYSMAITISSGFGRFLFAFSVAKIASVNAALDCMNVILTTISYGML